MNANSMGTGRAIVMGTVLSTCCYVAPKTLAQESATDFWGELQLGVGVVSDDSFKFGEYSGLEDSGVFALASFDLSSAFAPDDENAGYWSLAGGNLGLESRYIDAEFGNQGAYAAHFHYQGLPHYRFDDARTPFLGAGTANQTLPVNWIAANTTSGLRNLFGNLTGRTIETKREQYGGGLSWIFAKGWELSGKYQRETKDGRDTMAAIFGTNGGNPRGAILVTPIDYSTDIANVSLAYTGRTAQFSLAYHLSLFRNDNESLSWDNAFLRLPFGNTWAPGTDFASGVRGQLALAPDNQAHRVSAAGGYKLGMTSHLTANVSYGWMTQNERFLPYTINPNLMVPAALPRGDLDGRIETTHVNLGFSTRPTRKLDLRATYVYDKQDNETPRDIYQLVVNDSANQGALLTSNARRNTPYSFTTHRFGIDAGYRLPARSKLTLGYQYERRDRDFTEVESTDEHTGRVKLWSALGNYASGWIKYEHAERRGSTYVTNRPFLSGHNPAYIATLAPQAQFVNDPLLRKYNYADRDRDDVSATVNLIPVDTLSLSFSGKYGQDDYVESRLGLREREDASVTLDAAYSPNKSLTSYAFVTHERLSYEQNGYQRAAVSLFPGIPRDPAPCASCGFWSAETVDKINTVGAGSKWTVIKDKLNLKFDYTYSSSVTDIEPNASPNIDFLGLPALTSTLHRFAITSEYEATKQLGVRLSYLFEHLNIDDFAVNGVLPDTLANIISLGGGGLDYDVHVVGVSFVYRFR
ncbi:MAG: MtrB/PioB family decaheme-associated outer membrane protein [Gammaproteobacteria bacterium]